MKLKELFTNQYFMKGVKFAEYAVLVITAFCGIFWAVGFYYLGVFLGIVSLLLIVAKICLAKYETEMYSIINHELGLYYSEKATDDGNKSNLAEDIDEEESSNEHVNNPKYTFVPDNLQEAGATESIPNGMFDSVSENKLENELTPHGKELLKTWKQKYAEYENCIEMGWNLSDLELMEIEMDNISVEIQAEREKFLKNKAAEEEALKKAKIEENKKRLEARRSKLGL